MKILITGGCGFIGSNLAEAYLNRGHEVCVMDDLSTGTLDNIKEFMNNSKFHFEKADIKYWPEMNKWVAWADKIYHLAAVVGVYRVLQEPINLMETNVMGYECLLKAMVETQSSAHLILASSSSVYGHSDKETLSETDPLIIHTVDHPLRLYAISKITDEAASIAEAERGLFPITAVRLFNVIGPKQTGRYGMVVPRFVRQACDHEPMTVYGDGSQTRSFCDIRDVIEGLMILSERESTHCEIVNVGNDREISINDLALLVKSITGSRSDIVHVPYMEAYGMPLKELMQRRPNLDKFKKLTQYQHQWTLEQTIQFLADKIKCEV